MSGKFEVEAIEVDAFMAAEKTLDSVQPTWRSGVRPGELQASWGLSVDGISRGELRFRLSSGLRDDPSISVLYGKRPVFRADVVPPQSWKPNPPDAGRFGLDPTVYGPHLHTWADNRTHCIVNGFRDLPYRRTMGAAVRRLPQALAALADAVNLRLRPDQRDFDVPPKSDLFEFHLG